MNKTDKEALAAIRARSEASKGGGMKQEIGVILGHKIAEVRKARRLSLQALGDLAGCTKSHMWELESGRSSNPSFKMVCALADALGCSIDELTGRSTKKADIPDSMAEAIHACRALYAKGVREGKRNGIDKS